jgi:hypothetical protein
VSINIFLFCLTIQDIGSVSNNPISSKVKQSFHFGWIIDDPIMYVLSKLLQCTVDTGSAPPLKHQTTPHHTTPHHTTPHHTTPHHTTPHHTTPHHTTPHHTTRHTTHTTQIQTPP